MRILLVCLIIFTGPAAASVDRGAVERQFRVWLETEIWPRAEAEGVSRATFDAALGGVSPDWDVPGIVPPGSKSDRPRAQTQSEFRAPARYFSEKAMAGVVSVGRQMEARHRAALAHAEAAFGVPPRIVLAIWGRESGYGRVAIPHDAFRVLGTMAFMGGRSPEWFAGELVAALKIAEAGHAPTGKMRSSWAGALGQPQFMPSSFLRYARDGDGDGRADIWTSEADTIHSIAGYLADHGWQAGRDWGFEVRLPGDVPCALEGPDLARPIRDWAAMGIERVSGRPFPEHELDGEGFLLLPAGRLGPAFVVTPNFSVLKDYNRSDLYALFVGNAGDRIRWNSGAFRAGWRPVDRMLRSEVAAIQSALEARGYETGGADGLPGFRTRRSIGDWERTQGLTETCFPGRAVLARLAG